MYALYAHSVEIPVHATKPISTAKVSLEHEEHPIQ